MFKKIIVFTLLWVPLFSSESCAEKNDLNVAANDQTNTSLEESISKGKTLFAKNCIVCHGKDGRGKTPIGKTISNMPDFTNPAMKEKSDQELFDTITKGKAPMPSFKRLSEEDRWDLVHYIRTFASKNEQ